MGFMAPQNYFTYFDPSQTGKQANQSDQGKHPGHPQAEKLGLPHLV